MNPLRIPLYQIVDWADHFENAKSKSYQKCNYACVPNKQGGSGWSNVMGEVDGMAIYGVWMSIVQICSRQRSPRQGFLTTDGKEAGRRLSVREMANQLRRPEVEIHRCLQVVCSDEVGFMRILVGTPEAVQLGLIRQSKDTPGIPEGQPMDSAGIPEGHLTDPELSAYGPLPDGYPKDTSSSYAVSLQGQGEIERKRDREKEGLSFAEAAAAGIQQAQSQYCEIPPDPAIGVSNPDKPKGITQFPEIGMDEALERLTKIATGKRFARFLRVSQWPHRLHEELSRQLGQITREDLEYVEWAYTLPLDHQFFAKMFPRKSFEALVENLAVEPQKIRAARHEMGLNGLHPTAKKRAEPEGWQEIYRLEYPDAEKWPGSFWELTQVVRDELPVLREKWFGKVGVELNSETMKPGMGTASPEVSIG
jgi:hypothetical protein